MAETPKDMQELVTVLRRPEVGGPLRGINFTRDPLRKSLSLAPADLDATLLRVGEIAARLPQERLTGLQRAKLRRVSYIDYCTVTRNFAAGVQRARTLVGAAGNDLPAPARLEELTGLLDVYAAIARYAAHGVSSGMDLRQMLGAFQWYLLRQVTEVVVRRMEDPRATKAERTRWQNAFAGLLLHRERFLLNNEQRREERQANKKEAQQKDEAARRASLLTDTIYAMRMNLPVDQATLEEAAGYWEEEQGRRGAGVVDAVLERGGAPASGAGAAKKKPEPTVRKAPR